MSTRLTNVLLLTLPLSVFAGCDADFGRTGGPIANEAQQAADATAELESAQPAAPIQNEPANPTPVNDQSAPPVGEQSGTHVGRTTKEVLNVKEITQDPNWTVVASDPTEVRGFSAAGTAYNRAAALVGTANLEQWIKQEWALNGSYPTYQSLLDYISQNPVDMPALREYQHYGYDESTGNVVILENKQEKEGRRKELGLDPAE